MALNIPLDLKLAATIRRRRIAEEERKSRIFNNKQRTIGIDVDALNYQVHQNKITKQEEGEKEKTFREQLLNCNKLATCLQKQYEEEIRKAAKNINEFRMNDQRMESRREFDLNDPNRLKKELPARISDDDQRCSLSGLQKLEGEDLHYKDRTKKQKEQFRQSLIDQMRMKRLDLDRQRSDLHNMELKLRQLDHHAHQLALQDEDNQRRNAEEIAEFNRTLARQQKELQKQKQILDDLDKQQDIYNNCFGDLLSENPDVARSSFGPNRVVPDRWKGMSKEQLAKYYKEQKEQILEATRNKEKQQQCKVEWERMVLSQERSAILLQRSKDRQIKQLNQEQAMENNELAQRQRQQQEYLEKVVYSNIPSEDFYSQFNTTTR